MSHVPSRFGNLHVFSPIGQGGMGSVYAGLDLEALEFVAIKTLFSDLSDDEVARGRFEWEGKISGKLDHIHVVRPFGHGDQDGTQYLALEFVRGTDLSQKIDAEGGLPPDQVVEILEDLALALTHIHEKGIVHRDLKPENIILNQDGILKLLDFGIATLDAEDPFASEGAVVGTCGFASPEQNQGQDVGLRSDLYSLGATAWNLLTGQRWAQGQNPFQVTMWQLANSPTPPSEKAPSIPERLDQIVVRLMARDPEERFLNARELSEELGLLRSEEERKGAQSGLFSDPIASKWSVAKRSFYQKKYALCKSLAKYIADRRPDFAPVHFMLGKLFALENREFNSTDSFQRALELDPENLEYRADIALSLYRMNMFSLAKQELEAFVRQAPEHPLAAPFLELVETDLAKERPPAPVVEASAPEPEEEALPSSSDAPGAPPAPKLAQPAPASREEHSAQSAPEEPPKEAPPPDPEAVRSYSRFLPGAGRFALGDVQGGILRTGFSLGLLALCLGALSLGGVEGVGAFLKSSGMLDAKRAESAEATLGSLLMILRLTVASLSGAGFYFWWSHENQSALERCYEVLLQSKLSAGPEDGLFSFPLGTKQGLTKGQTLDLVRVVKGMPEGFHLGTLEVQRVQEEEAWGRFEPAQGITQSPQVGDQVRYRPGSGAPSRA